MPYNSIEKRKGKFCSREGYKGKILQVLFGKAEFIDYKETGLRGITSQTRVKFFRGG